MIFCIIQRYSRFVGLFAITACLSAFAAEQVRAADAKDRVAVAKAVSLPGTFIVREGPGKPWHPAFPKPDLYTNDLIVGAPGAKLESKNGAVGMAFLTDFDDNSPFPIRECAVILHDTAGYDLDFTLDRGRADIVNRKDKGMAKVRVQVRDQKFDITLEEPGTRVALELYGRWPKGVAFTTNPKPDHVPVAEMVILVIKGEAVLDHGGRSFRMNAPPGPALMHWDSVNDNDSSPRRLDHLPAWAKVEQGLNAERKARLEKLRELLTAKSPAEGLEKLLESNNEKERKLALSAMAALDEIPLMAKYMSTTKHPDVMDNGILTLRHWIGRGPGQDQKLYQMFIEQGKFTPAHAAVAMGLLHSFSDEQLTQPETYEILIADLDHERPAIRALAHWHLIRLAPAGKKIAYDPLEGKEKRAPGIAEWQKLIPSGKLPPKS
jgi:hypothetical protein